MARIGSWGPFFGWHGIFYLILSFLAEFHELRHQVLSLEMGRIQVPKKTYPFILIVPRISDGSFRKFWKYKYLYPWHDKKDRLEFVISGMYPIQTRKEKKMTWRGRVLRPSYYPAFGVNAQFSHTICTVFSEAIHLTFYGSSCKKVR